MKPYRFIAPGSAAQASFFWQPMRHLAAVRLPLACRDRASIVLVSTKSADRMITDACHYRDSAGDQERGEEP
jgi:hypothetical protein